MTVVALTRWPWAWSAMVSCVRLLQVQRRVDSGSPRVLGSINASRSARRVGSCTVRGLRPPPARRIRPAGGKSSG